MPAAAAPAAPAAPAATSLAASFAASTVRMSPAGGANFGVPGHMPCHAMPCHAMPARPWPRGR